MKVVFNVARNKYVMAFKIIALLAVAASSEVSGAHAQSQKIEETFEVAAREIAMKAVRDTMGVDRWPQARFPLNVSFVIGESLRSTRCTRLWIEQFREFVNAANARSSLVVPDYGTAKNPDVVVFYGSQKEFERSVGYRVAETRRSIKAAEVVFEDFSRFDGTFLQVFGAGRSLDFAIKFFDVPDGGGVDERVSCLTDDLRPLHLGVALFQEMGFHIDEELRARYQGADVFPIFDRVCRYLLAAMSNMPNGAASDRQVHDALVTAIERAL